MTPVNREELEQLASRVLARLGYDLVELEWKHEAGNWVLRVFIDFAVHPSVNAIAPTAGSENKRVTHEDCSLASRALDAELDVSGLIAVPFSLELSSPGINRPLKSESDFRRFAGQLAKIRTRIGISFPTPAPSSAPRRNFSGRLLGTEAGKVKIDVDGQVFEIPLDVVEKANIQYEF